jgi:glycosyltransferase involved in cell wall biosynthesis
MAVYNHAAFVREAVDSVLMQKTDFPLEIVLCDDDSTDGTREIVQEYAERHDNIVLSLQKCNTYGAKNMLDGLSLCRGKYVAICEGDDYWTAEDKLQTQVDFMEAHPDFTVCSHKTRLQFMNAPLPYSPQYIYKDMSADDERIRQGIFYVDECVNNYYMHTSSLLLRWRFPHGLPPWFQKRMLFDHFLFLLHAAEGKIKYFDRDMSVWRRHENGYSVNQDRDKGLFFQKEGSDWLACYAFMDKFFHKRFHLQIRERRLLPLRELVKNCLKTGAVEQLRGLMGQYWSMMINPVLQNAPLLDALRLLYPENRDFFPPWSRESRPTASPPSDSAIPEAPTEAIDEIAQTPIAIGGSLGLDLDLLPEVADSVWNAWTKGREYAAFGNARAALVAYCHDRGIQRIWLPGYLPPAIAGCLRGVQLTPLWYAVDAALSPRKEFLSLVQPGDAVLTVAYFGRPLAAPIARALARRPDVFWIEDRAHCLSAPATQAQAVLYSPRLALGVPDGGLLVGDDVARLEPARVPPLPEEADVSLRLDVLALARNRVADLSPALAAYEYGPQSDPWQAAHIALEAKRQLPAGPMSRLSLALLRRLPLRKLVRARQANWSTLYAGLGEFALWPIAKPGFAPLGFPLLLPPSLLTAAALTFLAEQGIRARQCWGPCGQSEEEKALAGRLLLLPLDHRYGEKDMDRVVDAVSALLYNGDGRFNRSQRLAK